MSNEELIRLAFEAREAAYAPYSNWKVGAALLCKNGKIYKGCNIENSGFSATVCAERTAFFKAVSEGEYDTARLAVSAGRSCLNSASRMNSGSSAQSQRMSTMNSHCGKCFLSATTSSKRMTVTVSRYDQARIR